MRNIVKKIIERKTYTKENENNTNYKYSNSSKNVLKWQYVVLAATSSVVLRLLSYRDPTINTNTSM